MTTIMVPIDGSNLSEAALPVAEWLARGLGADITLVMVGHVPETAVQAAGEREDLQRTLQRVSRHVKGLTVHERIGISNSPGQGIIDLIAEEHPDLVVMSTHGRSGWTEFVQGSVAEDVVRAGLAPVTLVHPAGAD
jgi:nucleotide-binding universal stress UspA family protein